MNYRSSSSESGSNREDSDRARLGGQGIHGLSPLVIGLLLLTAAMIVAFLVAGVVLASRGGSTGWAYAGAAAGICWVAATSSLVVSHLAAASPTHAIAGHCLAMILRAGLPMAALMICETAMPYAKELGMTWALLGMYLLGLIVETPLAVWLVSRRALRLEAV